MATIYEGSFLAVDTEATGVNFFHNEKDPFASCCPFVVTTCTESGDARYFDFKVDPRTRIVRINPKVRSEIANHLKRKPLVFHNAKYDVMALNALGIRLSLADKLLFKALDFYQDDATIAHKIVVPMIHDTMLASHVLYTDQSHKLKDLALQYLDFSDRDQTYLHEQIVHCRAVARRLHPDWILHPDVPADAWLLQALASSLPEKDAALRDYAVKDAERTALLWEVFRRQLVRDGLGHRYERELALLPSIIHMESRGVSIRVKALHSEILRYSKEAETTEADCVKIAEGKKIKDFNIRSGPQLQNLLHQVFRLPVTKVTGKTQSPATDAKHLKSLQEKCKPGSIPDTFITKLLRGKKLQTSTGYLTQYRNYLTPHSLVRGRDRHVLHPDAHQIGTKTTRFSMSNPNGQNVGNGDEWEDDGEKMKDFVLREVFGPATGRTWYSFDYQQLQLRIFAAISGEQSLVQAFDDGWDFHNYVASQLFNTPTPTKLQRRIAKNINFALIFGAGEAKVDATAGQPGAYRHYKSQFPNIASFMAENIRFARKHGYVLTPGGYRIPVPTNEPYKSTNYIVQGCEGEIVKDAMIACYRFLNELDYEEDHHPFLALQVHDELLFDFSDSDKKARKETPSILLGIRDIMEAAGSAYGIKTPVDCKHHPLCWSQGDTVNWAALAV